MLPSNCHCVGSVEASSGSDTSDLAIRLQWLISNGTFRYVLELTLMFRATVLRTRRNSSELQNAQIAGKSSASCGRITATLVSNDVPAYILTYKRFMPLMATPWLPQARMPAFHLPVV